MAAMTMNEGIFAPAKSCQPLAISIQRWVSAGHRNSIIYLAKCGWFRLTADS
jgi:hypothetical protein